MRAIVLGVGERVSSLLWSVRIRLVVPTPYFPVGGGSLIVPNGGELV